MNAAVNCLTEEERRHTLVRVCQENGGDERDTNNYFKRRMRELNEIAGIAGRGMDEYELLVLSRCRNHSLMPILVILWKIIRGIDR